MRASTMRSAPAVPTATSPTTLVGLLIPVLVVASWASWARGAAAQAVAVLSTDVDADASVTADGSSSVQGTSADGRYVAFLSDAPDLMSGQVNPVPFSRQLFLVDVTTGGKWMVSHRVGETTTGCDSASDHAAVSRDGSHVAFVSRCRDLVAGQIDPAIPVDGDLFLWTRVSNSTILVSHAAGAPTTVADASAPFLPRISANGRFVAFMSSATNLVAGQIEGNSNNDVFLFDRLSGVTTLVSRSIAGSSTTASSQSLLVDLSDDGNWVLIAGTATDLVGGFDDNNGSGGDLFVYERATGAVTLVSHLPGDATATGNSTVAAGSIDADGDRVAFSSHATDYVPGMVDGNGLIGGDVFLWQRQGGTIQLLSSNATGTASGNAGSDLPQISGNGAFVAYLSYATDLVGGNDLNNGPDVFLVDVATGVRTLVSHTAADPLDSANASSLQELFISDEGRFVLFLSGATDLVAGQSGAPGQVFLFDRLTAETALMSHALGALTMGGNGSANRATLAPATGIVLFDSYASDLVIDDLNFYPDVFASIAPTPVIFADGFETGDVTRWSLTAP